MIAGLIPAAGHSRRMGRPKLALPFRGRRVIEHVVATLVAAEVAPVLVVLGPHVADLAGPARAAGATALVLDEATPDMRATVEYGMRWLEAAFHPSPEDDWLLVPADHPTMEVETVRQLIHARRDHPERSILVPTFEGRRGHPTLIRWTHVAGIRAHPAEEGLNTYLRRKSEQMLEVPVSTRSVTEDLDTPEDYERLRG